MLKGRFCSFALISVVKQGLQDVDSMGDLSRMLFWSSADRMSDFTPYLLRLQGI